MGVFLKPGQLVELTVSPGRKLFLRAPTVSERIEFREAQARAGAAQWGRIPILSKLREGVAEAMANSPADKRDAILAQVDEQLGRWMVYHEGGGRKAFDMDTPEGAAEWQAAWTAIRRGDAALRPIESRIAAVEPELAQMIADDAVYWQKTGIEGARMFLEAVEGIEGFSRTAFGIDPAFLDQLTEGELIAIGQKVETMLQPTETERKNSDSPSPSESDPGSSTAKNPRPKKTRSKAAETVGTSPS
jgi:hypothetical protein